MAPFLLDACPAGSTPFPPLFDSPPLLLLAESRSEGIEVRKSFPIRTFRWPSSPYERACAMSFFPFSGIVPSHKDHHESPFFSFEGSVGPSVINGPLSHALLFFSQLPAPLPLSFRWIIKDPGDLWPDPSTESFLPFFV